MHCCVSVNMRTMNRFVQENYKVIIENADINKQFNILSDFNSRLKEAKKNTRT